MREFYMIGMDDQVHVYPEWFFWLVYCTQRRIEQRNRLRAKAGFPPWPPVIRRHRQTGYYQIMPDAVLQLGPLLSTPHFNPHRRLHASQLEPGGRGVQGKGLMDLLECGIDAQVARRELDDLAAALDDTPLPGRHHSQLLAEEALRQTRRRHAASAEEETRGSFPGEKARR